MDIFKVIDVYKHRGNLLSESEVANALKRNFQEQVKFEEVTVYDEDVYLHDLMARWSSMGNHL